MKNKVMISTGGIALLTGCLALLFSGCGSSRLANVWRDPAYTLGPMKSVLIISISKDPVRRRLWEDVFTAALKQHGVAATPSYELFAESLPDTDRIADAISRNGYDGMLILSRLPTKVRTDSVEPFVSRIPVVDYNPWRKKYVTRYEEQFHPGYSDTTKIVRHEVDLWAAKESSHMVWSATCLTRNPPSSQEVHDETAGLIAPALAKAGLIPSAP